MRGIKRNLVVLLILIVFIAGSVYTFAAGLIDPDQDVVLEIAYTDDDPIINAKFYIHKVADITPQARYSLGGKFLPYKDGVTNLAMLNEIDSKSAWLDLALTLKGIVARDDIPADAFSSTDGAGKVKFTLKPGLYLITGEPVRDVNGNIYTATPFLVTLPGEDKENNDWSYNVTVFPKFDKSFDPDDGGITGDKVTRKALKVWDDAGSESERPTEITVQLLCNGAVYDTQILSKENNWRYTWDNLPSSKDWIVVESTVEGYSISVSQSGATFVVTNSIKTVPPEDNPPDEPEPPDTPEPPDEPHHDEPEPPDEPHHDNPESPDTPDTPEGEKLPQTGLLWWPVPLLLCVGFIFIMIGVLLRRKEN